MSNTIYTVGHSTRSIEEFIALLQAHGVQTLIDVRQFPGSRKFPWFGKELLTASLAEIGIDYIHEADLGGRRKPQPDSPNTYWKSASFQAFADHMRTPSFQAALGRLTLMAEQRVPAIMCSEAVPWRCHRQLIADQLVAGGFDVRNILTAQKADPHKLNPSAQQQADGTLLYV